MPKTRLDLLLVERGLAESRAQAQRLVMAGQVRVNDQLILKPATRLDASVMVTVDRGPRYVSRGGEKLAAALQAFPQALTRLRTGCVCADVGSSTGGFTDCLLQHGAARVYAIDVGQGILDWKLRTHSQVIVMEGVNARYVANLPEAVQFVTIDASFISLKVLLPVVRGWLGISPSLEPGADTSHLDVISLIKPQFEAGKDQVRRGRGVIREPVVHRQVLTEILSFARMHGYNIGGLIQSPLLGPKGNIEFLAWLIYPGEEQQDGLPGDASDGVATYADLIEQALR
jgi:23S rRNA (cytidine1920-2'-O)/16S rRNA (cytidine1409-2'-O)-methyltransferase